MRLLTELPNPCKGDKAALPFHQQPGLLQQDLTEPISCSALITLPFLQPSIIRTRFPSQKMVKSYFFAPDFSTRPFPGGPIRLGSILRNITEFYPLNRTVEEIPEPDLLAVDTKGGVEISMRELHSADLGLKAKILELFGVGARASIEHAKGKSNVLSIQSLDTIAFIPTDSYIKGAMDDLGVRQFMKADKARNPLFMVTGLKIARGETSSTSTTSRAVAIEADVGAVPLGTPLEVGVTAGYSRITEEGEGWRTSKNDYIVSFKVRKIWKDRKGRVKHKAHNEMAVMQSAASSSDESDDDESDYDIGWDDDLTLEEIDEMFSMAEDGI
ncbi:hypothetical protein LCI18_002485 [Fusarium solani-melongenae]|uniref:Uncharacterized protein n=1 Tax=Fusarium solani subsp. cucurbitae TaxID=2747967 RepID=A0ACD3YRI8_FUSSC|nr:hypothetical protein LCI18_002485 [Fusarium solani-melongenae]